MNTLSPSDRIILDLLQRDARTRLERIAEAAHVSVATVQRRIRQMRSSGIISGEAAQVSPEKAGYAMTFLVLVELERERLDQLDAFRARVNAEAQVQQCYYLTGEADFALIILARDMQDFELLTRRLFFDDANVKRFRTSVVMGRTKVGLEVPMSGTDDAPQSE